MSSPEKWLLLHFGILSLTAKEQTVHAYPAWLLLLLVLSPLPAGERGRLMMQLRSVTGDQRPRVKCACMLSKGVLLSVGVVVGAVCWGWMRAEYKIQKYFSRVWGRSSED